MRRWSAPGRGDGARTSTTVSRWVMVNGLQMHARHTDGPTAGRTTVVLVHGLGMSSRYMEPLLTELAPHTRVLAVDLPGYGRSDSPANRLTLTGLADALAAWMEVSGVPDAVLVGNSLGAQVIAQLGVRHPNRIQMAVLVGPTRDPASGGRLRHTLRLIRDGPRERPGLFFVAAHDYLRAGPGRMWDLFGEALRAREEDSLRFLRVPALVVRGSRDPIASQEWAARIVELVPDARLVVIQGAGHAVNYSAPRALARVIVDFIRG